MNTPLSHVPFPSFPIHLEQDFWRHYNEISASVAWGALVLGECIYLAFYLWDLVIDYDNASGTLIVRLLVAAWVMVVLLLPASLRVKYLQTLYSATAAIAGVGAAVILALLRDGLVLGLAGILLVLMFNFGFLRLLFLPSLATGAIICSCLQCRGDPFRINAISDSRKQLLSNRGGICRGPLSPTSSRDCLGLSF